MMNKKLTFAIVIAAMILVGLTFLADKSSDGESVSKIILESQYEIELTPYKISAHGKTMEISPESFSEIQSLVLSDEFKNLDDMYKENVPVGSGCTQAGMKLTVYYSPNRIKVVNVQGCAAESPKLVEQVYGKIKNLELGLFKK